jgi:SAM-dependent methyltransferase
VEEIQRFYQETNEAGRLLSGSGMLEKARTQEILLRHLPAAPARILDVGGGPGEYAGWLSSLGYEVYLLDAVPKHIEQAGVLPLAGVYLGDARALPCEDGFADAVLMLGPLYHLTERPDRIQALSEARRGLREGGVVCAAAISRWASLLHSLVDGFFDKEEFWPILQRDLAEGQHRNDTGSPLYFTTSVFHRPDELRKELSDAGFSAVTVTGVEGPGWIVKDFDETWFDEARRERILTLVRQVENEAPLLGCSMHLIACGKKG